MNSKKYLGAALCLLAAVVWGFGFVAQDLGSQHVGPLTFQAARTAVATLALGALWLGRDLFKHKQGTYQPMSKSERKWLIGGGIVIFIGCALIGAGTLFMVI